MAKTGKHNSEGSENNDALQGGWASLTRISKGEKDLNGDHKTEFEEAFANRLNENLDKIDRDSEKTEAVSQEKLTRKAAEQILDSLKQPEETEVGEIGRLQNILQQMGQKGTERKVAKLRSNIISRVVNLTPQVVADRYPNLTLPGITLERPAANSQATMDREPPAQHEKIEFPQPLMDDQVAQQKVESFVGYTNPERRINTEILKGKLGIPATEKIDPKAVIQMAAEGLRYGYLSKSFFAEEPEVKLQSDPASPGNRSTELRNKIQNYESLGIAPRDVLLMMKELRGMYSEMNPEGRQKLVNIQERLGKYEQEAKTAVEKKLGLRDPLPANERSYELPRPDDREGLWDFWRSPQGTKAEKSYALHGLVKIYEERVKDGSDPKHADNVKFLDMFKTQQTKILAELFGEPQNKSRMPTKADWRGAINQDLDNRMAKSKEIQKEHEAQNSLDTQRAKKEEKKGERLTQIRNAQDWLRPSKNPALAEEPKDDALEKEHKVNRDFAETVRARIPDYTGLHPFHGETEKEGMEKFNKISREIWNDLVVHGMVRLDYETGHPYIVHRTDLDGSVAVEILKQAGIKKVWKDLEYVAPGQSVEGKINLDTGNQDGFVVLDEGKTVFLDHHKAESGTKNSTAQEVYRLMLEAGLLKRNPTFEKIIGFVTKADNMDYPAGEYGPKSARTMLGLRSHMTVEVMARFFRQGKNELTELSDKEMEDAELEKEVRGPGGNVIRKKRTLLDESQYRQKAAEDSERIIKGEMEKNGFVFDSPEYGKIIVDIDGRIRTGADGAKAAGAGLFIKWMPKTRSFFVSALNGKKLNHKFTQGKPIRETMWIKQINDEGLDANLADVLAEVAKDVPLAGELKEYIDKEPEIKKAREQEDQERREKRGRLRQIIDKYWAEIETEDQEQYAQEGYTPDEIKTFKESKEYQRLQRSRTKIAGELTKEFWNNL